MMRPPTLPLDQSVGELNVFLRRLNTTVRGIGEFERFMQSLHRTLEWVSTTTGRTIQYAPALTPGLLPGDAFETPGIEAPVPAETGVAGLIRVAPPEASRPFGPEDLRLVAVLAEFTGGLLDVAAKIRDGDVLVQLLRQVYEQLPVGVVGFHASGAQFLCNARARLILAEAFWPTRADALSFLTRHATPTPSDGGPIRYSFLARHETIMAEVHDLTADENPACTVIVLAEFEARQRNLRQTLEREIYRNRWLGQPLAFVVVETAGDPARLFSCLPEFRRQLKTGDGCDFLGQNQIGFVLPGRELVQALHATRQACRHLPGEPLKYGCMLLRESSDRAEAVIQETLLTMQSAAELVKPRLLVLDRYRAVAENIGVAMRDRLTVEAAFDRDEALRRLREMPVDALVVEHEPEEGFSGLEVLEEARLLQPAIVGILSTTRLDLHRFGPALPANLRVIEKPFSVVQLRAILAPFVPGAPLVTPPC